MEVNQRDTKNSSPLPTAVVTDACFKGSWAMPAVTQIGCATTARGYGSYPLGLGSAAIRGRPGASMKERIREPPLLAQKPGRSFYGEGLYATRG